MWGIKMNIDYKYVLKHFWPTIALILILLLSACAKPKNGAIGPKGDTGAPGSSCSVSQAINGALITCSDGTSTLIVNGTNGVDGLPGIDGSAGPQGPAGAPAVPSAYSVVATVDVCGDGAGSDEIFLRLANGQLIAHYAGNGNLQFLTLITPGSWVTTDQQSCHFTVDANLNITDQNGNVFLAN
jgi:hypothetical protein